MESQELKNELLKDILNFTTVHTQNKKRFSVISKFIIAKLNENPINETDFQSKTFKENIYKKSKAISASNNKIKGSTYSISHNLDLISEDLLIKIITKSFHNNITIMIEASLDIADLLDKLDINLNSNSKKSIYAQDLKIDNSFYIESNQESFDSHYLIDTYEIFSKILDLTNKILVAISEVKISINNIKHQSEEISNLDYVERFKSETELIIRKYENNIDNLTKKYEQEIKSLNLENKKISDQNSIYINRISNGLENLSTLEQNFQNIDLKISEIIESETSSTKTELEKFKTKLTHEMEEVLFNIELQSKDIEKSHESFKTQVQYAGIYNLTKNYKEKANEEKLQYEKLRKYTAGSILLAIISTLIVFIVAFLEHYYSNASQDTNYLLLISRLSIAAMFFILALYLSKQASKHYECFQENHRTFLQLAALDPYLDPLDADEQLEIRKSLIPNYFNLASEDKYTSKGDEVDVSVLYTLLDKISNLVPNNTKPANENNDSK